MTWTHPSNGEEYNVGLNTSDNQLQLIPNSHRIPGSDPLLGTYVSADEVITAGGYIRNVITINGQFPGPSIEVMQGAEIIVSVTNHLLTDGISIHWHGIYMTNTPWMDGVSFITQCPIGPKQMFTYRFKADPYGTHFYHAHTENIRLDGLYGMLVVHHHLPTMPEFHLMVAEWWHDDAEMQEIMRGTGENLLRDDDCDKSDDGIITGTLDQTHLTTIINGRGKGNDGEAYPLTVYTVNQGDRIKIRAAHPGSEYAYSVQVDDHELYVTASDGYDISPRKVHHIILYPGESMDFEIDADQAVGSYWIRLRTIKDISDGIIREGLAVVRYNGTLEQPNTTMHQCNAESPCTVFNCPFAGYADSEYKNCITLNDVASTLPKSDLDSKFGVSESDYEEYFYQFIFGMNGKGFVEPSLPLHQPHDGAIVHCDEADCPLCWCTHIQTLPFNKTVQMVFYNLALSPVAYHHPLHIHGHAFAIMKMGFPEYDSNTGIWTKTNQDIECLDNVFCIPAKWKDGIPPAFNQMSPPIKDTVIIPAQGYVVIRFRTDNPGFWFAHCHTEQHTMNGMSMVFNEAPELHPDLPTNFPTCQKDMKLDDDEFHTYYNTPYGQKVQIREENNDLVLTLSSAIGIGVSLVILGAIVTVVIVYLYMQYTSARKIKAVTITATDSSMPECSNRVISE